MLHAQAATPPLVGAAAQTHPALWGETPGTARLDVDGLGAPCPGDPQCRVWVEARRMHALAGRTR
jgi:hypothetical protein